MVEIDAIKLHSCIYKIQIHIAHTLSWYNRWGYGIDVPRRVLCEQYIAVKIRFWKITCLHYQYYSANAGYLKREQYGVSNKGICLSRPFSECSLWSITILVFGVLCPRKNRPTWDFLRTIVSMWWKSPEVRLTDIKSQKFWQIWNTTKSCKFRQVEGSILAPLIGGVFGCRLPHQSHILSMV